MTLINIARTTLNTKLQPEIANKMVDIIVEAVKTV